MRIFIVERFGKNQIIDTEILPRIGDQIDVFYRPFPTVKTVLLFPKLETIKDMGLDDIGGVDALITVE